MVHDVTCDAVAIERLAAEMQARGYQAKVIPSPRGPARVEVRNPAASVLRETIFGHAGAFWWPWRDPIAPISDITTAAQVIARVLATTDRGR
jgi:hypothetical protein